MSDETPQKSASPIRLWALIAVTVFSVFMVCSAIGQVKYTPFAPFKLDTPHAAVSNEYGTVVADSQSERLLFLNTSDELEAAVELDRYEVPIKEVNLLEQDGELVYVAGATRADDGESIVSEAVLIYGVDGTYLAKAWEKQYKDNAPATPSITDFSVQKNGDLMITRLEGELTMATHVEVIKVDDKAAEKVNEKSKKKDKGEGTEYGEVVRSYDSPSSLPLHDADYLAEQDRVLLVSESGGVLVEADQGKEAKQLYEATPTQRYQAVYASHNEAALYNGATRELLYTNDLMAGAKPILVGRDLSVSYISLSGTLITVVQDDGAIRVYDVKDASENPQDVDENINKAKKKEFKEVSLSQAINLYAVLVGAAWVYLIGLAIVLAVRWIIRSFKQDDRANLRRAVIAVMVTMLIMVTVAGHFLQTFSISTTDRVNQIKQSALYMASRSPDTIGDSAKRESQRLSGTLEADDGALDYLNLRHTVESLMQSYYQSSKGVQCNIYMVSQDGSDVRYLLSSQREAVLGAVVPDQEVAQTVRNITSTATALEGTAREKAMRVIEEEAIAEIERKNTKSVMYGYAVPLFASDGSCFAVAEMSFQGETFVQHQVATLASTMLEFGLIAIGIYVLFDELILSGHAWLTFRDLRRKGEGSAHTLLARPLMFASSVTAAIDTSLAVVIAKEMLTRAGVESNAFVWGVPALAITLGQTLGSLLHGYFISRAPARRLVLPLVMAAIGAQVLCAFAVMNNWFAAFVAGKFVMGVGYSVVSLTAKTLAGGINKAALGDNHEVFAAGRAVVIASGRPARIVAGIISGLLAMAGNQWIYFGAAVLGVMVLVVCAYACPKGEVLARLSDASDRSSVMKFVLSPKMIFAALFAALPVIIAGGYRSFIFPLFLEGANLSKVEIANLFVVGEVVIYFAMNGLIRFRDAHDRWTTTWVGLLGLGVTFGLLSLNQSPVWAVVAIVFINGMSWFAGDWKWQSRKWAKNDIGFNYDQSSAILSAESTAIKNLRTPILSGLVTIGGFLCCLVLAVVYLISGVLYALTTKKYR